MTGSAGACYSYRLMTAAERLSANLRAEMVRLGLTQAEFAAHLGITQPFVSELMSGKKGVSLPVLDQCAAKLKMDVAALFAEPAAPKKAVKRQTTADTPEREVSYSAAVEPQSPDAGARGSLSPPRQPLDTLGAVADALDAAATMLRGSSVYGAASDVRKSDPKVESSVRGRKGRGPTSRR